MGSLLRYGLAIVTVAIVVWVKILLMKVGGAGAPFVLFGAAILLIAIKLGRGPSLVAGAVSVVAANYYFLPPFGAVSLSLPSILESAAFAIAGVTITELTSRWRLAQAEMSLQRDLLRATLLSIGDAVVVTGANGRISLINPAAENLLDLRQEGALGKPLDEAFRTVRVDSPKTGLPYSLLTSARGKEVAVDHSGAPIRGAEGMFEGEVMVFRDITQQREAARALDESARRYASVLENISDGFVILDGEWKYVFLNEQAARTVGKSREELLGTVFWADVPDAETTLAYRELHRAAQEGVAVHFEEHRANSGCWYAIDSYPWPEGLSVFIRDVTEKRNAAEIVKAGNERFRRLYETSLTGVVFWNARGEVTGGNEEYLRITGYTREGLDARDGVSNAQLAPPEGVSGIYEKEYVRRDGTLIPVLIGSAVLPGSSGEGVSFLMDLTERKSGELRFRQLADHAPVMIWITGNDSNPVFFNSAWLAFSGHTMEKQLENGWKNDIHPGDFNSYMGIYLASFQARQSFRTEFRMRRHDGEWRWILSDGRPMYSPRNEFEGYAGSCLDITDRRIAEESLQGANAALLRSNADLRQFAHAASHDLQEPLRMVILYTQLLARRYKGRMDADADEFIDYATTGATRMHALVQDLLAFTEAADAPAEPMQPVDSGALLGTTLSGMRPEIDNASVTSENLPEVMVHPPHLTQLFQNLIGNALKYNASPAPAIHVSATRDGGQWVFSVKDNGIGIDRHHHERIFGIFKRLHREEYPGTGIGLAICTKIVERYGGRIWVVSEVGKGSEFLFTLPGA